MRSAERRVHQLVALHGRACRRRPATTTASKCTLSSLTCTVGAAARQGPRWIEIGDLLVGSWPTLNIADRIAAGAIITRDGLRSCNHELHDQAADRHMRCRQAAAPSRSTACAPSCRRLGRGFARACRICLDCRGRIVVTGMGKSGHIGGKIAATLASTGTPAFFLHPGEASHGDIGMITRDDVVLALSNSGETDEILTSLPAIKRLGVPLIALPAIAARRWRAPPTVHLDVGVPAEACPLNLAPTASTTAALAVGDALAVALLKARGFTAEDFARSHPAGALGRRLLLHVKDVMRTGADVPTVLRRPPLAEGSDGDDPQGPRHDRRRRTTATRARRIHRRRSAPRVRPRGGSARHAHGRRS